MVGTESIKMAYLAVTASTEVSEMAFLPMTGQTRCSEGAAADTPASEGAADVCAAQTHKLAVAITGSTDDCGRTSRSTNLGPPNLEALRPLDLGVLVLSARSE